MNRPVKKAASSAFAGRCGALIAWENGLPVDKIKMSLNPGWEVSRRVQPVAQNSACLTFA